jgi:hypothetical protein
MRRAVELHNIKLEPAKSQSFAGRKQPAGLFERPALTCPYADSEHTYMYTVHSPTDAHLLKL